MIETTLALTVFLPKPNAPSVSTANETVMQQGSSLGSTSSPSVYSLSPLPRAHQMSASRPLAAKQNEIPATFVNDIPPGPDLHSLLQQVQKIDDSPPSNSVHPLSEFGRDILARQSGLQDSLGVVLNKTRVPRWSHLMGTAEEVQF